MIVSSGLPSEKYPLIGIFEFDQAKALKQAGNSVSFLAVDLRSALRWRKWGITKGVKDGVDYYIYNFPVGRLPLSIICLIGTWCLKQLFRIAVKDHGEPDIIHAHFTEMGCITSRLKLGDSIPYIITEHSSKMNQYVISDELKICASEAYNNAKVVVSVGSCLANNIYRHTGCKPIVIPNIIDTELFFRCKKKKHEGFHLVTTSNLIILKRTWQILQALAMIDPSVIDFKLTVIGDGTEKDTLLYWREVLHLSERVDIVGYKSRESIASIYETADAFIMVSSSETFGVAYVEAMAAGLPVIATRCGGPEDFVNSSNGILVDVDDIIQISCAIKKIYNKRDSFDEDSLREFVRSSFSPNIIAEKLMKIYNEII